ncbi:MAG: hypothetical protein WB714_04215 [Candidatus Sulfotelmatobacter sp.]
MPKYVIEREIVAAGSLTAEQIQAISQTILQRLEKPRVGNSMDR